MSAAVSESLGAVLCSACGGAIAMEAGRSEPRCIFCGSSALQHQRIPEGTPPPEAYLPFKVSAALAASILGEHARKGFWRPGDFAALPPTLRSIYMPAWSWSGLVETHWCALISAATRSGKRPIAGAEVQGLEDVLTPASSALSRVELAGIAPYSTNGALPIPEAGLGTPYELGTLTRSVATAIARADMKREHERRIAARVEAVRFAGSGMVYEMKGRPLLLPAWLGTMTYRGRIHRFVINGQTGKLHGARPVSPWRVLAAVAMVGIVLAIVVSGMR